MQSNTKQAVIYCRVSTEEQANQGLSLDVQERVCHERAEKDGYGILEVIRDEGKSGSSLQRGGIKRVIRLAEEEAMQAVYMINGDRLARNTADHLHVMALFELHKIRSCFVYQPLIDRNTAMGYTMDTMGAVMSEHFSKVTSEKTKTALNQKALEGWFPSIAPVGYLNADNPNFRKGELSKRIIIPDPQMKNFVIEAFRLYATGNYSATKVNELMYEKGLRSKRGFRIPESRFYDMLVNRLYIGELDWGEVHLKKAKHEAIIDRVTFERVQAVLASHNHYANRQRKHTFLLRGIVRCNVHRDKRYTAEWHTKKSGNRFAYYHCSQQKGGCPGAYVGMLKLEDKVADLFKDLRFSKILIDKIISKATAKFKQRRSDYESELATLNAQKSQLLARRKVAEDKLLTGVLTDSDFTRMRTDIANETETIDGQFKKLSSQREVQVDVVKEILSFAKNLHEAYLKADPVLKRHYLLLLFKDIFVARGEVKEVIYTDLFEMLMRLNHLIRMNKAKIEGAGIIRSYLGA